MTAAEMAKVVPACQVNFISHWSKPKFQSICRQFSLNTDLRREWSVVYFHVVDSVLFHNKN